MTDVMNSRRGVSQTPGLFFVMDGSDGTGKATQTKRLVERLGQEGFDVETISFPQYGKKSAGPVEAYLSGAYGRRGGDVDARAASILFAVDRFDASFQIRAWLEAGKVVVTDRYVGSNIAHQGGKIADSAERREYMEWNDHLEHTIFNIPRPTLNIILHVPPSIAIKLAADGAHKKTKVEGDIHESDIEHLHDAAETYKDVSRFPGFQLIDCAPSGTLRTVEDIHDEIWSHIHQYLPKPTIRSSSVSSEYLIHHT